tara:strand:+ start:645 stop:887 length:243 start_codon:yes stop_codon:yes gene_type:complete
MKNISLEVKKIFSKTLKISIKNINSNLTYIKSDKWDSLNHMKLVAGIEKKFKVQFIMKDVIDMSSFPKTLKILNKYLKKK